VAAFALVAASGCGGRVAAREPAGKPASDQLRVLSYNVNFGLDGDRESVRAVAQQQADVVFLQETTPAWEASFVDILGQRYRHHRFTHATALPAGGMGVMSRFPIESIEELASHGGFFFAWRVVLATQLGRIQVLNVHLRPPMSDGGSWVVGYFSTRENRLEEIEHHLAALDPKLPTLIVGDFNEEADGLALSRLFALGYGDAIAQRYGKTRTWEWTLSGPSTRSSPGVTLRFQLDHILHDVHFVPVTARIVEAGRSDHKPIWADFERMDP
jgi:endonuclease/exonuclease/phosphatase (EEP) superfamily protein YafD